MLAESTPTAKRELQEELGIGADDWTDLGVVDPFSAWVRYKEMPGYEQSPAFAVSIGIGMIGGALTAAGLGTVLAGRIGNR